MITPLGFVIRIVVFGFLGCCGLIIVGCGIIWAIGTLFQWKANRAEDRVKEEKEKEQREKVKQKKAHEKKLKDDTLLYLRLKDEREER